jgi:hypothetical protein
LNIKADELKDKDNKRVIIIIVIIVAIIVIAIVSLMYYPEVDEPENIKNTTNRIEFEKASDEQGTWYGTVVKATYTNLTDIFLVITVDSTGRSESMDPLQDELSIEVINSNNTKGLNCSFFDMDNDNKLSRGDKFILINVEFGDEFKLIYKPRGQLIIPYKFY